ncbi:MAG: cation diffusion facilitator family transporter [Hyphococcus sp.]
MSDCNHQATSRHQTNTRRLLYALGVIIVFMAIEIVGGILSGSLALLADAAHMFTDGFALALAASAQLFAVRPADNRLHFGYRRAQVLAAFVNGVLMAVLLFWIVYEAFQRMMAPQEVYAPLMFWVAVAGLIANAAAFFILHQRDQHDVNMRGALLHVVGDLLGSVAAIVAAVVIAISGWTPIDPLLSLLVAGLIGVSAFRLIRETGHILLEGAPDDIDVNELAEGLQKAAPLIKDVHHVQIWQLTPEHPRLTLHACIERSEDATKALEAAKAFLARKYRIEESTIQIEVGAECPDRSEPPPATAALNGAVPHDRTDSNPPVSSKAALAAQD